MSEEHMHQGDADMRMALRGMRRDIEPGRDLWPGIAARLQSRPQQSVPTPRTARVNWLWPYAMAASLLLAVGIGWQFTPLHMANDVQPAVAQSSTPIKTETLVQREADSLTVHYESALREMAVQSPPVGWQPGLDALDASAIEIRTAMKQDPNSRLLLERLRATYTRRLVLVRRALYA